MCPLQEEHLEEHSPLQLVLLLFHIFQMKLKFKELFEELFPWPWGFSCKRKSFQHLRLKNKDHQACENFICNLFIFVFQILLTQMYL